MIAILSPAKNMRSAPERALPTTRPQRGQEAEELADVLCAMPAYELESTMQISPALALRAAADFAAWTPEAETRPFWPMMDWLINIWTRTA